MPIVRRNLTVHFERSVKVTSDGVIPQSVEVTVIPLQDASNAETVATYVGGAQTATATLLNDSNIVVFALVPSNFPGLSNPINYRIMWRVGGVTGRTETYDFAMPDVDISFDELSTVNAIIGSDAYLQQSDLGTPDRVAKLNSDGKVIDAFGEPVATLFDVATVQGNLNSAVTNIQEAASTQRDFLIETIDYQVSTLSNTLNYDLQQAVTGWNNTLTTEKNTRISSVNSINSQLSSLSYTVNASSASFSNSIAAINDTLPVKADLDGDGLIPIAQIPPEAITHWVEVDTASRRFSLTYPDEVRLGDVVLSPTGIYGLIDTDPSSEDSWHLLNQVQSVNGKMGEIVLDAADVGALGENEPIPTSQVTGLSDALDALAPTTVTDSLQQQIIAVRDDTKIVRLNSSNLISHTLLDDRVAYVNVLGQITKKDGTIISDPSDAGVYSLNGQRGVVTLTAADLNALTTESVISQDQIAGLVAGLASKADILNGKVILSQIPTLPQSQITSLTADLANKANLVTGTVPLAEIPALPQSKITGLSDIVTGNGLASGTNAVSRITSLEGRVSNIEANGVGGEGNGTSVTTSVFWGGVDDGDVQDFATITLASPFGIYSSGPNVGQSYYNKDGVPSVDAAFPVITPGGHLRLYKWDETNAPDIVYATATALDSVANSLNSLSTTVDGKTNQSDFSPIATKVNQFTTSKADLDSLTNTLVSSQIPFLAKTNPKVVANTNAMRQLTTSQVHIGDHCIVTGVGTYTLMGNNVSQIASDGWVLHPVPSTVTGAVTSISGPNQVKIYPDGSGNVSLLPSDIGAASTASLSAYVTAESLSSQLATKASQTDINNSIASSQLVRGRVDYAVRSFTIGATTYCATGVPTALVAGVPTPSGSPAIDKDPYGNLIYAPNNALVLLTNQADAKSNGIWKVNTGGNWTRPPDYATGTRVVADTLVMVNNNAYIDGVRDGLGTYSGTTNYTLWQSISTAVVDSTASGVNGATTWRNMGSFAPVSITGTNGITITGQYPSVTIGADVAGGFVRKYNVTVVPPTPVYTVNHGLNTPYPQVTVIANDTSQSAVLVGWRVGPPDQNTGRYDTVILEFNNSTYNNSYRISVQG